MNMNLFWIHQLKTALKNQKNNHLIGLVQLIYKLSLEILKHHRSTMTTPIVGGDINSDEKLTVIVLNHKRPENVNLIAQLILRAGFVGKLIISNNSQDYSIESYIKIKDPRLILINQKEQSGVGIRFVLAKEFSSPYYICIDDDIFLHPAQLQWLYWNLRQSPEHTHGIYGAKIAPEKDPKNEWPFYHESNKTITIDILNGLFSFTREHLEEYFKLCSLLGITDHKSLMNGEDIILSFSGIKKPLIHDIGPIWECASASLPGVALHVTRPHFYEERWGIFSKLEKIKPLKN